MGDEPAYKVLGSLMAKIEKVNARFACHAQAQKNLRFHRDIRLYEMMIVYKELSPHL